MATNYGLRCRTCNEDSDTWVRSYPANVAALVEHYPAIREIVAQSLRQELPWWLEFRVEYTGLEGEPPHLFLAEHYAHDLIDECDPRVDDKWGPAGCVRLEEGTFYFFGWASS